MSEKKPLRAQGLTKKAIGVQIVKKHTPKKKSGLTTLGPSLTPAKVGKVGEPITKECTVMPKDFKPCVTDVTTEKQSARTPLGELMDEYERIERSYRTAYPPSWYVPQYPYYVPSYIIWC